MISMLPAACVLAAAGYFRYSRVFCVLTVFTTVFAVVFSHTLANTMSALFVICHNHPAYCLNSFVVGG